MKRRGRTITSTFKAMHKEGQGVYCLTLITPADVRQILSTPPRQAAPEMLRLIHALVSFLRMIGTARPAALCLLCDNELVPTTPPHGFALITAYRDDPANASISGLCSECCGKGDLVQRAFVKCRESSPSLRILPINTVQQGSSS